MTTLNWISPKFEILGINPKEVFSIRGGKIITTFTNISFYNIWTLPSANFGMGRLDRTSLVLHRTSIPTLNFLGRTC